MHACHSLILGQILCSCSCCECCIHADPALRLDHLILSTNCKSPLRGEEQTLQARQITDAACVSFCLVYFLSRALSLSKLHRTFLKQYPVVNSVSNNGTALFV